MFLTLTVIPRFARTYVSYFLSNTHCLLSTHSRIERRSPIVLDWMSHHRFFRCFKALEFTLCRLYCFRHRVHTLFTIAPLHCLYRHPAVQCPNVQMAGLGTLGSFGCAIFPFYALFKERAGRLSRSVFRLLLCMRLFHFLTENVPTIPMWTFLSHCHDIDCFKTDDCMFHPITLGYVANVCGTKRPL